MTTEVRTVVSAASAIFIVLLWIGKSPKSAGQNAIFLTLSAGNTPFLFRLMMTFGVVFLNIALWGG